MLTNVRVNRYMKVMDKIKKKNTHLLAESRLIAECILKGRRDDIDTKYIFGIM